TVDRVDLESDGGRDLLHEYRSDPRERPTHHDVRRVQREHRGGENPSHRRSRFAENLLGNRFCPLAGVFEVVEAPQLQPALTAALEYCRDGGHCLQASALATAARATIGSGAHVPQLAGQAAPPMYQAATNDDPSSDPGGDPQVDEIAINHVAMDRFGQCGETCVGIQLRCQAETLSDRTLDGTASTF